MSAIFRIIALMILIYLLASLTGNGEVFRSSSGFLMLTAISAGVYLVFRSKSKPPVEVIGNQKTTQNNSIKIIDRKPIRNTGKGFVYGLVVSIIVVYLFHGFFGNASFQFFLFIDNLLRFGYTSDPVFMWAVLGLFAGLVSGSFVAWQKYGLAFKVNLIPVVVFLLLIFILIKTHTL